MLSIKSPAVEFSTWFALVDGNNFYASCETVFNPSLRARPLAILSNNDGCIIARSRELKDLGVPMGAPIFQWRDFLHSQRVEVISANFPLYGDMSRRMMGILSSLAKKIEIYSIDEAFMDFSGLSQKDLLVTAWKIHDTVPRGIGIPVGVGIGPTKVLAKTANQISKKTGVPFLFTNRESIVTCLRTLPIEDVWGIGRRLTERMRGLGIVTAYDFYQKPQDWVRRHFTITEQRLHRELRGDSCLDLEEPSPKHSICVSRSFGKKLSDPEAVLDSLRFFLNLAAEKLRKQKCLASCLHIFVQALRTENPPYRHRGWEEKIYSNYRTLSQTAVFAPTNETPRLLNLAEELFSALSQEHLYRKSGVVLSGFIPLTDYQPTLFEEDNLDPRQQSLLSVMDSVNRCYGSHTLRLASLGKYAGEWKMNQEYLSPAYTTRWEDLLIVRCSI